MRSKLFVPADRADLMIKSLRSEADAICFDLEDAVPSDGKAAARLTLREFLHSRPVTANKLLLVRINPVGSEDFQLDLEAISDLNLFAIALPKVESIMDVLTAINALTATGSASTAIRILPTIESARGLRLAAEIASASPSIVGLQLGFADLLESLGIPQENLFARQQLRLQVRLAAAEAGVPIYDSAFADFRDEHGFRDQLTSAKSLGFAGTSCIHPRQIATANEIFSASVEEIEVARRIVRAADLAADNGQAVFALDGKMIDRPFIERARRIISEAADL